MNELDRSKDHEADALSGVADRGAAEIHALLSIAAAVRELAAVTRDLTSELESQYRARP